MQNKSRSKSQSAMEYLMTYGWAILIIAVVLGALYYLGVFNTSNLTPRAQPGSCKVIRPNGPGTTTFINLAGVCTGQLPQFVGYINGVSYIDLGENVYSLGVTTNVATFTGWVKAVPGYDDYMFSDYNGITGMTIRIDGGPSTLTFYAAGACRVQSASSLDTNWHFIAGTYNGVTMVTYIDAITTNTQVCSSTFPSSIIGNTKIGARGDLGSAGSDRGYLANLQMYNTSLSIAEIQGLYAEGIGGAPTRLQNLVGWWPLNGNANDYSGNGNSGAATNVAFTSTWTK